MPVINVMKNIIILYLQLFFVLYYNYHVIQIKYHFSLYSSKITICNNSLSHLTVIKNFPADHLKFFMPGGYFGT